MIIYYCISNFITSLFIPKNILHAEKFFQSINGYSKIRQTHTYNMTLKRQYSLTAHDIINLVPIYFLAFRRIIVIKLTRM